MMRFSKRYVLWTALALLLCLGAIQRAFFSTTSTHHSSITLSLPDGEPNQSRRIADFDKVSALLNAWAPSAGFAPVAPQAVASMRQSWSNSAANGNEKTLYYTEQNPKNRSFPIEIMICFDPDGSPNMQITASEGYSKKPSPKLQTIHSDLEKLLAQNFPDRLNCRIW